LRGLGRPQVTRRPAQGVAVVAKGSDLANVAAGDFYTVCKELRVPGGQERTPRIDIRVK
jgi:hypothetical protein